MKPRCEHRSLLVGLFLLVQAFLGIPSRTHAADVSTYLVIKARTYLQPASALVIPQSNSPFFFNAVVNATTATVSSATLTLPDLMVVPFTNFPTIGPFAIVQGFANQAALDSAFTNGNYQFTINAVTDGQRTPTLTVAGDAYPGAPTITNFNEAQLIDSGTNFTVRWAPFTGGNLSDNIVLAIVNVSGVPVLTTPIAGQPGALNGTNTSYTITNSPTPILAPGQNYFAKLTFAKVVDLETLAYPLVLGAAAYASATDFPLRTLSNPRLQLTPGIDGAPAQVGFNADIGRSYVLEGSTTLTNWTVVSNVVATATNVVVPDPASISLPLRFYRLRSP
jgi:hypothetical protein